MQAIRSQTSGSSSCAATSSTSRSRSSSARRSTRVVQSFANDMLMGFIGAISASRTSTGWCGTSATARSTDRPVHHRARRTSSSSRSRCSWSSSCSRSSRRLRAARRARIPRYCPVASASRDRPEIMTRAVRLPGPGVVRRCRARGAATRRRAASRLSWTFSASLRRGDDLLDEVRGHRVVVRVRAS